ncbi:MAG: hypothetical protein EBU10_08220, partial [Alphaproteobacteria bacterium]|nr:hypothetical protein [Alphaproteobacteria bacterium]
MKSRIALHEGWRPFSVIPITKGQRINQGQSMKVLHIVAGAGQGGAETFCLDAVKALHDRGVEQVMIGRP